MHRIISLTCALIALSAGLFAQEGSPPPKVTLIKAGRLLDVREGA